MSDSSLTPSSSATFALTLDQNVTLAVRRRVDLLQKRALGPWIGIFGGAGVSAAAWLVGGTEAALLALGIGCYALPLLLVAAHLTRKSAKAAKQIDQARDVCFVGPDGLVFFDDDGYFVEQKSGRMPYGAQGRSLDHAACDGDNLTLSSTREGYSVVVRVPRGWTDSDTARVQRKLDAFNQDQP